MMHSQVQALANEAISCGVAADENAVQTFLQQRLQNSAHSSDIRRFSLDVLGEMEEQTGKRDGSYEGGSALT